MYLIQMLLPRVVDGKPVEDAAFAHTRAELVEVFGGVTAYLRAPAQGAWLGTDGRVDRDEVVMVEVLAENFDRRWWRRYAQPVGRAVWPRGDPHQSPSGRDPIELFTVAGVNVRQPSPEVVLSLLNRERSSEMYGLVERVRRREEGVAGYIFLWALGVPASVLFLVFLVRGCT
jgi:hypothetical protein